MSTVAAVEAREQLEALGAATIGESGGRAMHPRVRPVWPGARVAAPAYTADCPPGDNLAIHVAVTRAPSGHVLCASVGEARELGYWGEVLTVAAQSRGLAGLVIDGGVRDVDALARRAFPVFSTGIALGGATKDRPGRVGVPVVVGGVEVHPGDWLVGDADGVTAVPAAALGDVLAAGKARAKREAGFFAALGDGATTLELLSLDPSLVEEP